MTKLVNGLSALIVYICIGQTLVMALIVGLLIAKGGLTHEKFRQIAAVVQGVDLLALREKVEEDRLKADTPQPSTADLADARARAARDLEIREQELVNVRNRLAKSQNDLAEEADRFRRLHDDFEARLKTLRDGAIAANMENARLMLENMKPKQAKEQIQKMLAERELKQAVTLLSSMPIEKRSKIITEFKTEEESEQLSEMLRLIRAGEPEVTLVDEAQKNLANPGP
jgi:hypothetical protein